MNIKHIFFLANALAMLKIPIWDPPDLGKKVGVIIHIFFLFIVFY